MKTESQIAPFLTRGLTAVATPLLLAFALALAGCATRKQVAEIVTQSNAAMLAGQFGLPNPNGTAAAPDWQLESDRIEAFIVAHPGLETVTAPLRLRQGMLLLTHRQVRLAEAAFNQVDESQLHTARDQALKRNQPTLLWWFAHSTNHTWTTTDQNRAQKALLDLKAEQKRLVDSPEIRDYLAEMRAWIGLSAARQSTSTQRMRGLLEEALDVYAETFTSADLAMLADGREDLPDPQALGVDVRRRLRARAVLDAVRELNQRRNLGARLTVPVFDHWINP
jgi:hypothetical protein